MNQPIRPTDNGHFFHSTNGLIARLSAMADDEEDEWAANVLRQSANRLAALKSVRELCTTDHESKEEFICPTKTKNRNEQ